MHARCTKKNHRAQRDWNNLIMVFSHTFHVKQNGQVANSHFHNCKDTIFIAFSCPHAISKGITPFIRIVWRRNMFMWDQWHILQTTWKPSWWQKEQRHHKEHVFTNNYFWAEFHTNVEIKMKMEYIVTYSSFLGGNLPKKFFWKFFITFALDWGVGGGGLVSTRFLFFGTSSRNMLPFNAKSFLGWSHMIQHEI